NANARASTRVRPSRRLRVLTAPGRALHALAHGVTRRRGRNPRPGGGPGENGRSQTAIRSTGRRRNPPELRPARPPRPLVVSSLHALPARAPKSFARRQQAARLPRWAWPSFRSDAVAGTRGSLPAA